MAVQYSGELLADLWVNEVAHFALMQEERNTLDCNFDPAKGCRSGKLS